MVSLSCASATETFKNFGNLTSQMRRYKKAKDKDFRLKLDIYAMDPPRFPSYEEFDDIYNDRVDEFFPSHLENREPPQNINPNVRSSDDAYETFTVLSCNIHTRLLDKNNNSSTMYNNCSEWAIEWNYRREKLLHEIITCNADIICLQEVPRYHLENFFKPRLKAQGYSVSVICKKDTSKKADIDVSSGTCVTCFRANLFQRIEESSEFEFGESKSSVSEAPEPEQKRDSGVIRPQKVNLALILKLKVLRDGGSGTSTQGAYQPVICVANTRIYSQADDSNDPTKKMYQVIPLVLQLESFVQPEIPFLICGDLDFFPESNAHEVLPRHKEVLDSESHVKPYSVQNEKSAYASLCPAEGIEEQQLNKMDRQKLEPSFVKFTSELCGTVDYILYRVNTLKEVGLFKLQDEKSVSDGLPSSQWSSDHVALMATFRFIPLKQSYRDVLLKRTGSTCELRTNK